LTSKVNHTPEALGRVSFDVLLVAVPVRLCQLTVCRNQCPHKTNEPMRKFTSLTSFALFLVQFAAHAQTTSWRGTTSTDWSGAANWTAGVPTSAVDAIIGDVNFTGANQPSITANRFANHSRLEQARRYRR